MDSMKIFWLYVNLTREGRKRDMMRKREGGERARGNKKVVNLM